MKMFLRLGVFVFLGIAFMLVVEALLMVNKRNWRFIAAGGQAEYDIGDPVQANICCRTCNRQLLSPLVH